MLFLSCKPEHSIASLRGKAGISVIVDMKATETYLRMRPGGWLDWVHQECRGFPSESAGAQGRETQEGHPFSPASA